MKNRRKHMEWDEILLHYNPEILFMYTCLNIQYFKDILQVES